MATLVPDVITSVSLEQLLRALHAGYGGVMGDATDSAACLACLGSQLSLESGRGKKAHCFNWGNEKLPRDWTGLYCQFTCDEIFDPKTAAIAKTLGPCEVYDWKGGPLKRVVLHPPHPWSSFVAFGSAEEGTAEYIKFLIRDRYRAAWHCAFVGDITGFSHELRKAGYYTADEDAYTRGLVSLFKELLPICQKIVAGETDVISDHDRDRIMALIAQTSADIIANDNGVAAVA